MENTSENKPNKLKKYISAGLLAHVDAGKTTLAEAILYLCGSIRKLGRVDHRDAFLDTYELERSRGITIFSKQAQVELGDKTVTLLDTPGHVDFSAEMERTLQVLDYGILVISGADGVQGHVETLWRLLRRYRIPVFIFINKMDQEGTDRGRLMDELRRRLDERCVDFGEDLGREHFLEELAMCQEAMMEEYLETGEISRNSIADAVAGRQVFPCFFGSALKLTGVEQFLSGMERYVRMPGYPEEFGARVFKIARDAQGNRLTYLKVTGGSLKVKTLLSNRQNGMGAEARRERIQEEGTEIWEEKVDQIRLYSGSGYSMADQVGAGSICAVLGLSRTRCGQGLGCETESQIPLLEPVLTYGIGLPEGCDVHRMLGQLRQLEEEIPELHIIWKEAVGEIHAQVMGEVQMEILTSLIHDRFGVWVEFGEGSIVYKETIARPSEGIGHFEPLRHYAEVHLLLEPGEPGSGLQFGSVCSEDDLDRNWQRLILTHLEEKQHPGVLTGSEITDMRITLAAGRAHIKHTEGGDFRQATYRAVRQGLKKTQCVLLEPIYEYMLEIPSEMIGRAMTDIQRMQGSFSAPRTEGEMSVLEGSAPVQTMRGYQKEVIGFTRGRGRLTCTLKGYEPCHNAQEVIAASGYDSEADLENPTGSVFCAHGAGFVVSWDKVDEYAHVESGLSLETEAVKEDTKPKPENIRTQPGGYADEKELEEIFARTYGPVKRERSRWLYGRDNRGKSSGGAEEASLKTGTIKGGGENVVQASGGHGRSRQKKQDQEEYLLVDGYNIIFAWDDLRELAEVNIDSARDRLMDVMANYQGYLNHTLILVFDAYKVKGNPGSVVKYHNIYVVYTREAETADQYIEKTVHEIARKYHVTVATSDALEQLIIWGQGASRLSAQGLLDEVRRVTREMRENYMEPSSGGRNFPFRDMEGMNDFRQ